jgi:hypothetical protein
LARLGATTNLDRRPHNPWAHLQARK